MRTVLWIDSEGSRWWIHQRGRWVQVDNAPAGAPTYVITDLADEAFAELTLPRLFGKDRVDYLQRQLALRFPESRYRALLPPAQDQGWIERLAPRKQVVAAIESSEGVDSVLHPLNDRPVIGVWSASEALAHIGSRRGMPPNLFVLVHNKEHLRIVFLKQRIPLLTRRVRTAQAPLACANELVRTLRHLENTHAVDRDGQRFGVLVLGSDGALAQHWGSERLDLVSAHPEACEPLLLDAVTRGLPGQLAPLGVRIHYVSAQVRRAAWVATASVLALTVWLGAGMASDRWQQYQAHKQVLDQVTQLQFTSQRLEREIAAYGVDPVVVKKALQIDSAEIEAVPGLQEKLLLLSQAMNKLDGGVRIQSLSWSLKKSQGEVCSDPAKSKGSTAEAPAAAPEPALEVRVELTRLGNTPWERERSLRAANDVFRAMQNVTVVEDPAKRLRSASVSVGGQRSGADDAIAWCMRWPGATVRRGAPA